jgi:exodeoxyribonuclease V alpha subunit
MGKYSVSSINDKVAQLLRQKGLIIADNDYYAGRPIMVTQNHYKLNLYNGDTGLLWPDSDGKLYAVFPEGTDDVRWLSLGRLPKVDTVYAMTIHKTQGSEFGHVALVLPEQDSPLLSRELLYTAITRASEQLSIYTAKAVFMYGVTRKVQRYSGLRNKAILGVGL